MNKLIYFLPFLAITLLYSCSNKSNIEGLWVIKLVQVGDQEMTPNAKWTRFYADSTQHSGNGWYQHSHGTWNLDNNTMKLSIKNTNGLNDPYPPFDIRIEDELMHWSRTEDGQNIKIVLQRSNKLPETFADRLLGLWELEEAIGDGKYFKKSDIRKRNGYLFMRWDRRFVIGTEQGRINGVYNVNGHKPELELIPYGDELNRNFWKVDIGENSISLELINSDSLVVRKFIRINEFPE